VADITVEVSSAGLTAYGAGAWSSSTFGGDSITNVSIGTVDAFYPDEGWGGYYWGYLVWGQNFEDVSINVTTPTIQSSVGNDNVEGDGNVFLSTNLITSSVNSVSGEANFAITVTGNVINLSVNSVFAGENVIVEVTTPGAPTTWGQGSFGQYAWNQITGSSIDLGEETITAEENITLILSTNLLTLSITSLTITADANLSLNTNLLNIEEGFAQENVEANTIVEVSAPGNLPWGATSWGNGSWGNIGGMEVSQGAEEESTPGVEVFVSTNLLTLTLTSIAQITADANITANTNLLTVGLGDEDAVPNTIVTLSTNLLNVSIGTASGEVLSTVSPTGVSATASTGRLYISAWAVVDIGVTNNWSVVDIAA
jgi:hypothetical protein